MNWSKQSEVTFKEGYHSTWIDQLIELHNKTELCRSNAQKVDSAFQASFAVVTSWSDDKLIGCGRMISDGIMYSGIFDVVVDPSFQGRGIGKHMMKILLSKAPDTCIHLTSTFGNEEFYMKLGFKKHRTAFAKYPGDAAASRYLEQKDTTSDD